MDDNMNSDADSMSLDRILGDMDDMESNRVYGDKPTPAEGVSITIDVAPKKSADKKDELPEDHTAEMCEGGCVKHMNKGGVVPEDDEMKMPPFLRKRK